MKRLFKFFALMLVAITLVSCNQGGTSEDSSIINHDYNPFGKYEREITVTGIMEYIANTDSRVPVSTTPENQAFIRYLKEDLNINFQYKWKVPSTQYQDRFNMMLLSGDYPDIMKVYASDYYRLRESKKIADLSEALKYASDDLMNFLNTDPEILESVTDEEGHVWAIPVYSDTRKSIPVMYIRKDWLDQLDLEIPTNPTELKHVASQFVSRLGAKVGIATSKGLTGPYLTVDRYLNIMGGYPFAWIKDGNGNLIAGEVAPQAKEALKYLRSFYEEGLLPRDFASHTVDSASGQIINEEVGIVIGPWWQYEWPLCNALEKNPQAEWVAAPVPSLEGYGALMGRRQIDYYYVVNKKFKNPEVLIKMINMYIALDGTDRAKPENGYVWSWVPTQFYNPNDVNTQYEEINAQLEIDPYAENEAPEEFASHSKKIWKAIPEYLKWKEDKAKNGHLYNSSNSNMFANIQTRVEKDGAWAQILKTVESGKIVYNEFFGEPTKTMKDYGSILADHVEEQYLKMIMGTVDIDGNWDSFVSKWYQLKGDLVTQEVNAWYQSYGYKD